MRDLNAIMRDADAAGMITPADVIDMRRNVFGTADVTRPEAEALFRLAQMDLKSCPEWRDFFIEAISDYLVEQAEPRGYVGDENADWLIGAISRDGRVWSDTELELVIKVLEKAISSPQKLVLFALECVRDAVLSGDGLTRRAFVLRPGCVGDAEVDLLRRALYAYGGAGSASISREEAEVLFDINDATLDAQNSPEWRKLFVRAIASHVLLLSGLAPPSREEALRREDWLMETDISRLGFFRRIFAGGSVEASAAPQPAPSDAAAAIDDGEAAWLRERILRNDRVDSNQKALLSFLEANSASIPASLRGLRRAAA